MPDRMTFEELRNYHDSAPFHRWAGIELVSAAAGVAIVRMTWKDECAQAHEGLHAGLISALLETACGSASDILNGLGLVTHLDIDFLNAAKGSVFTATGRVVRNGRRQIFVEAELISEGPDRESTQIASARALLIPMSHDRGGDGLTAARRSGPEI